MNKSYDIVKFPNDTFENYTYLLNKDNTGARRNGILSEELYYQALVDPSTIFTESLGSFMPVLVPAKYGMGLGYDVTRCNDITLQEGNANCYMMAVPLSMLTDKDVTEIANMIPPNTTIFLSNNNSETRDSNLDGFLDITGGSVIPIFQNNGESESIPSVSLHSIEVVSRDTTIDYQRTSVDALLASYSELTREGLIEEGRLLLSGRDLTGELLSKMWELYKDRFQWLGDGHPISMEDTYEDFADLITDESTLCSIRTEGGEVVCFTYFVENMDKLYWLNKGYLENYGTNLESGTTTLFFPGIVSSGQGLGYSSDVIETIAKPVARSRARLGVLFENTNISEAYIPKIVESVVNESDSIKAIGHRVLDKTIYYAISIK